MKNLIRTCIITLLIGISTILISCKKDFLDYTPQGALGGEVISNKAGVDQLLIGAYAALYGKTTKAWYQWDSAPSNFEYGSGNAVDAYFDVFPVLPNYEGFDLKWGVDYDGITRCNQILVVLPNVKDISDVDKTNIIGQVRFLRAYFYFDLKKMFNMVPWIDETTTDPNQPNDKDIWPKIEEDFKFAMDNLPKLQKDDGRCNKWAAAAFLAKTYLYEDKYSEAKAIFDQVIDNGVTSSGIKYGLNSEFEDNFRPEKEITSPEAVFSINMAANVGNGSIYSANEGQMEAFPNNSPFGCCGNYNPTLDLANSYRTDAVTGLPYLDDYNSHPLKTDLGVESNEPFVPDQGTLDPRLDWTVGRRGIPFLDWQIEPGKVWDLPRESVGPYHSLKNIYWQSTRELYGDRNSWAPGTAINVRVIGFDDVLLMAAECEAELGNLDQAQIYVNRIRDRAANPAGFVYKYKDDSDPLGGFSNVPAANYFIRPYPDGEFAGKGKAYTLNAIYFERKLELAMEGQRFFDLSRWGILDQTLQAQYSYDAQFVPSGIAGVLRTPVNGGYFPIPLNQIDLSDVNGKAMLQQNPGYK